MMQSCASAVKLRAAEPFFSIGISASSNHGFPPLGSSIRQCAEQPARAPNSSVVILVPVSLFSPLDVRPRPPVSRPTTRASSRTMACCPRSGFSSNRCRRACSICLIWPITRASRAMSRSSSAATDRSAGH
jgi:hypothetical protein